MSTDCETGAHCSSCPSAGTCSAAQQTLLREANEFSKIKHVIAVMSGKGGVGKSSVSVLLASHLQKAGYQVGLLDADITGPSIPRMFGITEKLRTNVAGMLPSESAQGVKVMSINLLLPNEDDPVLWRGPVIGGVIEQFWTDVIWGELDYLVVDLPPGTGDAPLTVMQSLPLKGLIVVTSPQELAVMVVRKAIKMAEMMNQPILGVFENMAYLECPHCEEPVYLFGQGKAQAMAAEYNLPFLGSLPIDPALAELCDQGRVEEYESELFAQAAKQIAAQLD